MYLCMCHGSTSYFSDCQELHCDKQTSGRMACPKKVMESGTRIWNFSRQKVLVFIIIGNDRRTSQVSMFVYIRCLRGKLSQIFVKAFWSRTVCDGQLSFKDKKVCGWNIRFQNHLSGPFVQKTIISNPGLLDDVYFIWPAKLKLHRVKRFWIHPGIWSLIRGWFLRYF